MHTCRLFSGMDSLTRKKCYATLTSFLDLQEYPYDGVVRKRGQASPDEASAEGASLTVLWLLRLLQVLLVKVLCVFFFCGFSRTCIFTSLTSLQLLPPLHLVTPTSCLIWLKQQAQRRLIKEVNHFLHNTDSTHCFHSNLGPG